MTQVLEVKGVYKRFKNCDALAGVEMSIPQGQIAGLLGPNASGKTTLLKTVAGLLEPTSGEVLYHNNTQRGPQSRASVGFCPDSMGFPRWMRVMDAFKFYSDMYPDYSPGRAEKLIEIMELGSLQLTHVHRLSKGMRERLMLSLTFSRETKLYLLDEPLDGIDPVGKTRVIDAILTMQPEGSSTLVSTHLVKDIERIFDSVYFLSRGRIVFHGQCDNMREEHGMTVEQKYLEVFINEGAI